MRVFRAKVVTDGLCRRAFGWTAIGLLALWPVPRLHAQPSLGLVYVPGVSNLSMLTLSNCADTNFQYIVQTSTNLADWISVSSNAAASTNLSVTLAAPTPVCYYRLVSTPSPTPVFQDAVLLKSNLNANGKDLIVDSFNSSSTSTNNIDGQWAASVRLANGNVATESSVVGETNIGYVNIYGHVMTGPGTVETNVQIGPNGAVGDLNWNANDSGIESNYWSGNFTTNFPDVTAPAIGSSTVPATVNGYIPLTGGNYTWASDPGTPLLVSAPTTVWVQGSFSSGIVFSYSQTNSGSLTLYVGNTSGSAVTLDMSTNGTMNSPGYAANFQIYGLPTLTSIKFSGNAQVCATVYAPEATVENKGGGKPSDQLDTMGAIIANEVILNGHWNFHYDQALTNRSYGGPFR